MPALLSGFVCAYHPATPGSSPKHTIYAFYSQILYLIVIVLRKRRKYTKEAIFKKVSSIVCTDNVLSSEPLKGSFRLVTNLRLSQSVAVKIEKFQLFAAT